MGNRRQVSDGHPEWYGTSHLYVDRYCTPSNVGDEDLDDIYWQKIDAKPAPIYGVDVPKSLFNKDIGVSSKCNGRTSPF